MYVCILDIRTGIYIVEWAWSFNILRCLGRLIDVGLGPFCRPIFKFTKLMFGFGSKSIFSYNSERKLPPILFAGEPQ